VFSLNQAVTQGGPAVILILVSIGMAVWAALASGILRFGRECDYRDTLIAQLTKANDEFRSANASLIEANRQQAQASQAALDLIRQELLPRLAQSRGA